MKSVIIALVMAFVTNAAKANYIIYRESKDSPGTFPLAKAKQYLSDTVVGVIYLHWDKGTQTYVYFPKNLTTGLPNLYWVRTFHPWTVKSNGSDIMPVQDYVMQHYTVTIHVIDGLGFEHVSRFDSIYNCGDAWIYYPAGMFTQPSVMDHIYAVPQPSANGSVRSITISTGDPVRQPAKP